MPDINSISGNKVQRTGIFILFMICGLMVFLLNMTFTDRIPLKTGIFIKSGLAILFLLFAILLKRSQNLHRFWNTFFAFFMASASIFLALHLSKFILHIFNLDISQLTGFTSYKFLEDLFIIAVIISLTLISGDDLGSIYVCKGRLKTGLFIGIISFLVLSAISVCLAKNQGVAMGRLLSLTPSILIIVLADGFMEELLFRGLFLRKFQVFLGPLWSNVLTALIFALVHLQITYISELFMFLALLFGLGMLWGYLMQRTDSIWASALFHAGADTLIILQFLAGFGIE